MGQGVEKPPAVVRVRLFLLGETTLGGPEVIVTTERKERVCSGGQAICCPRCGRFLLRITSVKDPEHVSFSQEIQCQAKGCHRAIGLTYEAGRVSLVLL